MNAYGSTDDYFLRGLVDQVANASSSADLLERPDELGRVKSLLSACTL